MSGKYISIFSMNHRQVRTGIGGMALHTFMQFIRLGRFPFLLSGFVPFLGGAFFALLRGADFSLDQFLLGYTAMAAAHLSVHYSNDYFDADADRLGEPTGISGGSGILAQEPALKPYAKWTAIALMAFSILLGYLFLIIYEFPSYFLIFAIGGNLLGWYYTAPPLRLAYNNLGEVTNMITFGLLMPGAGYFVAMGTLDLAFFAYSVPFFLYGLVFITSVEIPDREADVAGGKPTMIVRKGRAYGFRVIAVAAAAATLVITLYAATDLFAPINFWPVAAISCIPLGVALWGYSARCTERKCAMRYVTANITAYFLFTGLVALYFILLAIGI
ncbi:prenyltransferase [Methanoculleus frigidifontis]|nr:prenyltransferase [Methanoculleus sp. FWC-SCC1]